MANKFDTAEPHPVLFKDSERREQWQINLTRFGRDLLVGRGTAIDGIVRYAATVVNFF